MKKGERKKGKREKRKRKKEERGKKERKRDGEEEEKEDEDEEEEEEKDVSIRIRHTTALPPHAETQARSFNISVPKATWRIATIIAMVFQTTCGHVDMWTCVPTCYRCMGGMGGMGADVERTWEKEWDTGNGKGNGKGRREQIGDGAAVAHQDTGEEEG